MKTIKFFLILSLLIVASRTASSQDSRYSNVEFNALAIDEDKCPGVMVFPGTRSGSYNAYYYLVKPYPKMNIDFEDVAYIPSFKKSGDSRSFFYAIYFPSYNETNPFDEYADIPCSKEQLKREILRTLPANERPDPSNINLSRLKINTLSFSIPKTYKSLGFDLIYDEALSDTQNAGVLYSRGTFLLELKIPETEFEKMLEILRSDMGFPLSVRMGFKAKEQRDYKEVYVDIGSLANELKVKLGAKKGEFLRGEVGATIKTSSSFANIQIYGETENIDKWISEVLIPMLSAYTTEGKDIQKPTSSQSPYDPYNPYPNSPYSPGNSQRTSPTTPEPALGQNDKVLLNLTEQFKSDVKKFTFKSDVLNPNATQEYLVYQFPLRYYGELDGNYFVLESNRYEETDRDSRIFLNAGESVEFTVEGYWKVTPKLVRHKFYFTKDHLDSSDIPYLFSRGTPDFKIEKESQDLYLLKDNFIFPGFGLAGKSTSSYIKIGRTKLEPVNWGNGYFPKYFNWEPMFPDNAPQGGVKSKYLRGTNLFDVKVPINDLRPYKIKELLRMIPLGIRLWKGKAIAANEILSNPSGELANASNSYFTLSFDNLKKTVKLTAKKGGHLYFENLDFVEPIVELRPREITDDHSVNGGEGWRYITRDDFINIDDRLFKEIEKKDYDEIDTLKEKQHKGGEIKESSKTLQYDFAHMYLPKFLRTPGSKTISREVFFPLDNPKIEARTYIKLKIFDKE